MQCKGAEKTRIEAATEDRITLESLRSSIDTDLSELERTGSSAQREQVAELRKALAIYWRSLDPVFDWTPEQKAQLGRSFLRRKVVPYREAVLSAIEKLGEFNSQQGLQRQQQVLQTEKELRFDLRRIASPALVLGAVVAAASILRTRSRYTTIFFRTAYNTISAVL